MIKIKLKELREEQGLSQAKLAKELNISARALSYYETGARELNYQLIDKLCKYFNVSSDYLLGRTNF